MINNQMFGHPMFRRRSQEFGTKLGSSWRKNNLVLPSLCGSGQGLVWVRLTRQQKHIEKYSVLVVDRGPKEREREIYIYSRCVIWSYYGYKWNTASFGPAIHIGLPLRVSEDLLQKAWKRGGSNLRFPSCPVQMKVKFSRIRIHRKRKREKHTWTEMHTWTSKPDKSLIMSYQPFPNFPSPAIITISSPHHHQPIPPPSTKLPKIEDRKATVKNGKHMSSITSARPSIWIWIWSSMSLPQISQQIFCWFPIYSPSAGPCSPAVQSAHWNPPLHWPWHRPPRRSRWLPQCPGSTMKARGSPCLVIFGKP